MAKRQARAVPRESWGAIRLRGLLAHAGRLAEAARNVVGGPGLDGFTRPAANVWHLSDLTQRLAQALEAYDAAIRLADKEPR